VSEVFAEVGYNRFTPAPAIDDAIDDAGLLSFKLSNGVYGTLDTSWSRPASYPTWGDVKLEILGEKGMVGVDAFAQKLSLSSNSAGRTQWVGWGSDMDQGLIADFLGVVRGQHPPSITGEDGLAALAVALAAYQSARTGQAVALR
jgi:predicted dehydrogenase